MNSALTRKETKHLRIFFLATLLWTWVVGMMPVMLGINNTALGDYIFVFTAGIAPSCVGIIMVLKTYTKEARSDYFKRFRPTWRGLWFVILYAILLISTMTVSLVLFLGEFPDFTLIRSFGKNPLMILGFLFFMYLYGPANEEFGWRGYALDKMLVKHGFLKGSLILGLIWGIWHLPWVFYGTQWQSQAYMVSHLWFFAFVLQCMASSLVISIGYIVSKRNCFISATIHGVGNAAMGLIYSVVSLSGNNMAQIVIIALGLSITAVTLGVFGKQFTLRYDQAIREMRHNEDINGMEEVYRSVPVVGMLTSTAD
ncbi:MAG: type II CAAX endopeptidase family protein [Eubacteriales bacterium]|jgi:membrane protease YdiL (CAAX protease family)|nr:type II CAAX endopeptidase family protein [Eubacteriales bacterium]MDD4710539.1 type II CAAX endopeptidase family protein [Eubacteriales bacterium]NLO14461.1 CPBP family intramembrane metalloprotease [Clostridiales bacterium]